MMSPQSLITLLHETRHSDNAEFLMKVDKYRVFTEYDARTQTKYYNDFIRGRIIMKTKKKFWFGYNEEVVYEKMLSLQHENPVGIMIKIINEKIEMFI